MRIQSLFKRIFALLVICFVAVGKAHSADQDIAAGAKALVEKAVAYIQKFEIRKLKRWISRSLGRNGGGGIFLGSVI